MSTLWDLVRKAHHEANRTERLTVIIPEFKKPFHWPSSGGLIKETLLKLDIFSQSPKGDLIEENLTYSIAKLFSDFGGNLGLWVGVSVLTVAEIVELVVGTCLSATYAISYVREDEKRAQLPRRRGTAGWGNEQDPQGETIRCETFFERSCIREVETLCNFTAEFFIFE